MYNNKQFLPNIIHPLPLPEYKLLISSDSLKEVFSSCSDFECREIFYGLEREKRLTLCWLDGTVSSQDVSISVIKPLTELLRSVSAQTEQQSISLIMSGAVYRCSVRHREIMDELVKAVIPKSCLQTW